MACQHPKAAERNVCTEVLIEVLTEVLTKILTEVLDILKQGLSLAGVWRMEEEEEDNSTESQQQDSAVQELTKEGASRESVS